MGLFADKRYKHQALRTNDSDDENDDNDAVVFSSPSADSAIGDEGDDELAIETLPLSTSKSRMRRPQNYAAAEGGGDDDDHGAAGAPLPSSTRSLIMNEIREQLRTSGPAMVGMLTNKIPWLLSIRFAGNLGVQELAAAALATTLFNVTGLSLSVGLSSALSTLTGQARGDLKRGKQIMMSETDNATNSTNEADEERIKSTTDKCSSTTIEVRENNSNEELGMQEQPLLPLVFLYRGMLIQLLVIIPVGLWWLLSSPVDDGKVSGGTRSVESALLFLGQGPILASMTASYLRVLSVGLLTYSINWTFTAWLQAMEMADVPAFGAIVALVLHIPFNLLYIHWFQWGYLGVGAATVTTQSVQLLYILWYLFLSKKGSQRLLDNMMASNGQITFFLEAKIAIQSLPGIFGYLSLALPGIVLISEWWASEVSIFLSGRLTPQPDVALDAMTIYQSINAMCFMLPMSCSIAGSARIANFLGSGDSVGAYLSAKVSMGSCFIFSVLLGSILFLTPHNFFPSFFSPDEPIVQESARLISLLSIYVVGDGIQQSFNGVIKGCGRQCVAMPIVLVAYWIVGVPLAYYFAFDKNHGIMCENRITCGVTGLVAGMCTGTWVHCLLLGGVVVFSTNWSREAIKAQERLSKR